MANNRNKPNQVPTNADLGELAYQGNDRLANIPRKGQALTASYKLKAEDAGHWFKLNSGASITIPNEVFQDGDVVTLYNNTNSTITITCIPDDCLHCRKYHEQKRVNSYSSRPWCMHNPIRKSNRRTCSANRKRQLMTAVLMMPLLYPD